MTAAERLAELADIQGAWRREGRSLGRGPWAEVADVVWVQVGQHFCDVRHPPPGADPGHALDAAQAFSGTLRLSGGAAVFEHDLDSLGRDAGQLDHSTLTLAGGTMMERGDGFEERWSPAVAPGAAGACIERRDGRSSAVTARIVRAGRVVVGVWGGAHPGGCVIGEGDDMKATGRVDTDVAAAARALAAGAELPQGWVARDRWT
ncbi:MAG TPA: hypothetical protein VL961_05760 [Acidimicrobiales bacterium]|nr:hypothetical protein [Acidimicrobiales bacterium]